MIDICTSWTAASRRTLHLSENARPSGELSVRSWQAVIFFGPGFGPSFSVGFDQYPDQDPVSDPA
jgi:hypothetical protein